MELGKTAANLLTTKDFSYATQITRAVVPAIPLGLAGGLIAAKVKNNKDIDKKFKELKDSGMESYKAYQQARKDTKKGRILRNIGYGLGGAAAAALAGAGIGAAKEKLWDMQLQKEGLRSVMTYEDIDGGKQTISIVKDNPNGAFANKLHKSYGNNFLGRTLTRLAGHDIPYTGGNYQQIDPKGRVLNYVNVSTDVMRDPLTGKIDLDLANGVVGHEVGHLKDPTLLNSSTEMVDHIKNQLTGKGTPNKNLEFWDTPWGGTTITDTEGNSHFYSKDSLPFHYVHSGTNLHEQFADKNAIKNGASAIKLYDKLSTMGSPEDNKWYRTDWLKKMADEERISGRQVPFINRLK